MEPVQRAGQRHGGRVKSLGAFLEADDKVLVRTHATFRFAVDYNDIAARRLASPESGQLSFGGELEADDVESGTIYILRSFRCS